MISWEKSGNQRPIASESRLHPVLRTWGSPDPGSWLGTWESVETTGTLSRYAPVGSRMPAACDPSAANPPGIGADGLSIPVQETLGQGAAANPPRAPGRSVGLPDCVA